MNHPTTINYEGGMESLAEDIGNLRYDALAKFLRLLATKIGEDSEKDRTRGRKRLSKNLSLAASNVLLGAAYINFAWEVCKKHMRDEDGERCSRGPDEAVRGNRGGSPPDASPPGPGAN